MSARNIYFYGELTKIILQLSSNTLLICSSELLKLSADDSLCCVVSVSVPMTILVTLWNVFK